MSVYKEFFYSVQKIKSVSSQIFSDACDFGAKCKKGDEIWNCAALLAEMYGDKKTYVRNTYATGKSCSIIVNGIHEWSVPAIDVSIKLDFVLSKSIPGYDGYVTVSVV